MWFLWKPVLYPEKGWGDWEPFVALDVPSDGVKQKDFFARGIGFTAFLCKVDDEWVQRCIHRFDLKPNRYFSTWMARSTSEMQSELKNDGVFDEWQEKLDVADWQPLTGGPFTAGSTGMAVRTTVTA